MRTFVYVWTADSTSGPRRVGCVVVVLHMPFATFKLKGKGKTTHPENSFSPAIALFPETLTHTHTHVMRLRS